MAPAPLGLLGTGGGGIGLFFFAAPGGVPASGGPETKIRCLPDRVLLANSYRSFAFTRYLPSNGPPLRGGNGGIGRPLTGEDEYCTSSDSPLCEE